MNAIATELIAGKYELVRMLGRGGMGTVWEGRHTSLGTRVAVKLIDKALTTNPDVHRRFLVEARAAASIQSKHAIAVHDFGALSDGTEFIVMDMLVGETLADRLARSGRVPLRDVASIVQQVCRALQQAHDRGIIHRDLKPENIFLTRATEDEPEVAKVLDFGLAKLRAPTDVVDAAGTRTGVVVGTPLYMSPEQGRGLKTIDHRTDLWALGVITFECATGRVPFDADSLTDLLVRVSTSPAPTPSHLDPGLPRAFDAWMARALHRDPDGRFRSATELAETLVSIAVDPARAGVKATQPMRRRRPRRRVALYAACVALLCVAVCAAVWLRSWRHSHRHPIRAGETQSTQAEEVGELATSEPPALPTLTPVASSAPARLDPAPTRAAVRVRATPSPPAGF
jgi:serine/threonine protein kinase